MDNKKYILFHDSGVGGLTILKYFLTLKNNVNIIYYPDTRNFPYGLKNEKAIGSYLLEMYDFLSKSYNIEMVVIACNTASVSALDFLRKNINIPVIGTVPAIKPAAKITKNNKIGIIATETTVKLNYLKNLIKNFASDKEIFVKPSKKLVEAVEYFYEGEKLKNVIEEELTFFKEKNIDTLVLGCTHYSFLEKEISDFFDCKVQIVDSREGVSKRIIELMPETVINDNPHKMLFLSEGKNGIREKYIKFNEKFKIFQEIKSRDDVCPKD
jgi:glutamate racemase